MYTPKLETIWIYIKKHSSLNILAINTSKHLNVDNNSDYSIVAQKAKNILPPLLPP